MNKKIVLVAWVLCSMQAFGMTKRAAPAAGSAALSSAQLPWTKGYSSQTPWMQNASRSMGTDKMPVATNDSSSFSRLLWGQDGGSKSDKPFNKWKLGAPVVFGAGAITSAGVYNYYEEQKLQEMLAAEHQKLQEKEIAIAWLRSELEKQKEEDLKRQAQEAQKGFNEIFNVFDQKPDQEMIPTVMSFYDTWISKLPREKLNQEFRVVLDQYTIAKERMLNRKWESPKYLYMTKNDMRMRDADRIEMDGEIAKMSEKLDEIAHMSSANRSVEDDQQIRSYLKAMKKDVLKDKVAQAWWLNTLSAPAGIVDKWIVRRNS